MFNRHNVRVKLHAQTVLRIRLIALKSCLLVLCRQNFEQATAGRNHDEVAVLHKNRSNMSLLGSRFSELLSRILAHQVQWAHYAYWARHIRKGNIIKISQFSFCSYFLIVPYWHCVWKRSAVQCRDNGVFHSCLLKHNASHDFILFLILNFGVVNTWSPTYQCNVICP